MSIIRLSCLVLALAAMSPAQVETEPSPSENSSVDRLIASFQAEMNDIRAGLKAAEAVQDEKEYARLIGDFKQTPRDYLVKIRAAVRASRDHEAIGRALAWMYRKVPDRKEREAILARLVKDHGREAAMAEPCRELGRSREPGARRILEDQLANNPHREVKGEACFALAQHHRNAAAPQGAIPPATRKMMEPLLERVVEEFADLPHFSRGTLGAAASAQLFELRRLRIGATAPEITGRDIDGVALKLSDYRGKVVYLDFWGHW